MVKRTGGADRFSGCLQIEFTSRRSRNKSNRVRTRLARVILRSVNDVPTAPRISERIRFPLINDRFLPSAVRSLQDAAAGHEGVHVVHVDQILQSQQRPSFVFVRRWETRRQFPFPFTFSFFFFASKRPDERKGESSASHFSWKLNHHFPFASNIPHATAPSHLSLSSLRSSNCLPTLTLWSAQRRLFVLIRRDNN